MDVSTTFILYSLCELGQAGRKEAGLAGSWAVGRLGSRAACWVGSWAGGRAGGLAGSRQAERQGSS